jgi:hypothetical protein
MARPIIEHFHYRRQQYIGIQHYEKYEKRRGMGKFSDG